MELRVKIASAWWRLVITKDLPTDLDGFTDNPTLKGRPRARKRILVSSSLSGRELLETILHESLHAADQQKNETFVEIIAHDQSKIIVKPEILERLLACDSLRAEVRKIMDYYHDEEDP